MKTDSYKGITLTSMDIGGEVFGVSSFRALGIHLSRGWPTSYQPVCLQKRSVVWGCRVCYAGSDCQVSQRC